MAISFLQDDLHRVHRMVPSDDTVEIGGNIATGFITRETMEPDEPGNYSKTLIIFRSPTRYEVREQVLLNGESYTIAEVYGEEGAWQHRIVGA